MNCYNVVVYVQIKPFVGGPNRIIILNKQDVEAKCLLGAVAKVYLNWLSDNYCVSRVIDYTGEVAHGNNI